MRKFVVVTLLAAMPFFLVRGQFTKITKKKLNELFAARVEFSDMDVSLLCKFPNTYVALDDFLMIGTGAFEGDTLLSCKKATIIFGLVSAIRRKHIKIKSIVLEQPRLYAHILENGQPNWKHIMKPKKTPPPRNTRHSPLSTLHSPLPPPKVKPKTSVSIHTIEINNAGIAYSDDARKMTTSAEDVDLLLVNDRGDKDTDGSWSMRLDMGGVDVRMGNVYLMRRSRVGFVSEIMPNPDAETLLRLNGSRLRINDMGIQLDGKVGKDGRDMVPDISFRTEEEEFKRLLSLIPAMYTDEHFDSLQTAGTFRLEGSVKGKYNKQQKPVIGLNLKVDSAMFKYPHLPDSADNIHVAMRMTYDGATPCNTALDIDRLHVEPAGEPFDMNLHVKTPQNDTWVDGAMKGMINLEALDSLIPLRRTKLTGFMACDLSLSGLLSTLEKKPYEGFRSQGLLELNNINLTNDRFPQGVDIPNFSVNFTPRTIKLLRSFVSKIPATQEETGD
ncbi:MAG: hypothetical protein LBQ39_04365 [Tannerellaceae bacterium]|nr:hypothetical protein [Tannerellaceae bacterium]